MPELEVLGEFIQVLAVVQLDLCSLPEEVLQFRHDGDLRLHAHVQTSQLLVQLQPDICNNTTQSADDVHVIAVRKSVSFGNAIVYEKSRR